MNIILIGVGGVIIAAGLVGMHQNNKKSNGLYSMYSIIYVVALIIGLVFALAGVLP